jgi:(R,R)-butanediol dehydrogenase / meso-butanediol dehydrogenase / diacetyl reductase
MLAAVFKGNGVLKVEEVPVPKLVKDDDVLMQVEACGICGTDKHILEVPPGFPGTVGAILGHEYIGIILAKGKNVTFFREGDRVAVDPNLHCGTCRHCRLGRPNQCENFITLGINLWGGFTKYNVAPAKALYPMDRKVPVERAFWAELLSCVIGGTEKVRLQPGETVAVLGAGPVGQLFTTFFKAAGAGRIIVSEPIEYRRKYAKKAGADVVVDPNKQDAVEVVLKETVLGADVVIDAVGHVMPDAIKMAKKGGKVVVFGMNNLALGTVRQNDITRNELSILGTYIGVDTFPPAIAMLESGAIDPTPLTTHILPVSRIHEGVEAVNAGQCVKVMVTPE